MELSQGVKVGLRRTETLFLCLLFQVAVPALPFAPFKLFGKPIPDAVWATGAAMYVLALAAGCKSKAAFSLNLVCGLAMIGLYGLDPAKVDADLLSSDRLLPSIVMAIVGAAFLLDRCYYHLFEGEGFGPWEGK